MSHVARKEMREKMKALVLERRFAEVDAWFDANVATVGEDGILVRGATYMWVSQLAYKDPNEYDKIISLAGDWVWQRPKSLSARLTLAQAFKMKGWAYRGEGWASGVNKDHWKPFNDNLNKANRVIDEALKAGLESVEFYTLKVSVGSAGGASNAAVHEAFLKGKALDPANPGLVWDYIYYKLPRWRGSPGEWERELDNELRPAGGRADFVYALMVGMMAEFYDHPEKEMEVDFKRFWSGCDYAYSNFKNVEMIDNYDARFSWLLGNKERARARLEHLGPDGWWDAWRKLESFRAARHDVGLE